MTEHVKKILSADSTQLVLAADKEGKITIKANPIADKEVMLKGQKIEITNVNGQVYVVIKGKG